MSDTKKEGHDILNRFGLEGPLENNNRLEDMNERLDDVLPGGSNNFFDKDKERSKNGSPRLSTLFPKDDVDPSSSSHSDESQTDTSVPDLDER